MLAFLLVFGLVGGWLLAGRMLAPLARITDATRTAATGSLSHRIRLPGRRDEFRELADAFDAMLARLEAHVAEQQRFAANASHELRTPLAITQTLLDVARNDPNRDNGELVDRLHAVNTRAIDLTEALLLLSRADQRSFTREHVDLSLIAEEATETLLPLAEERGVTIETSGDMTPTIGSHALLLQLTTNLVHNAIVHNLPEQGTVWVTTSAHPERVVLTVENTGEKLTPQLVSTLAEPFQRGDANASAPTTQASASAWQSSRASPKHTTEPSPSPPGPPAGSASRCNYPPRRRASADDDQVSHPRPGDGGLRAWQGLQGLALYKPGAGHDGQRRHVLRHDGSCSDDGATADSHARADRGRRSDPDVRLDDDRIQRDAVVALGKLDRMSGSGQRYHRADQCSVTDADAASVRERATLVDEHPLPKLDLEAVIAVEGRVDGDRVGERLAEDLAEQRIACPDVAERQRVEP